jgi:hypothetical protein
MTLLSAKSMWRSTAPPRIGIEPGGTRPTSPRGSLLGKDLFDFAGLKKGPTRFNEPSLNLAEKGDAAWCEIIIPGALTFASSVMLESTIARRHREPGHRLVGAETATCWNAPR